jgi:hypothetical protein
MYRICQYLTALINNPKQADYWWESMTRHERALAYDILDLTGKDVWKK